MATRKTILTPSLFGFPDEVEEKKPEPVAVPIDAACYARVAVQRPLRREFTYAVPHALASRVQVGSRVAVLFARRRHVAVVVGLEDESDVPPHKIQWVLEALDTEPVIGSELLGLTRWIADRYACSWGDALAAVLPAPLKREAKSRRVAQLSVCEHVTHENLSELEAGSEKQYRLLRHLMDLGEPTEMRPVLRRLNLSDSPARTLERRGWVRIEMVEARTDDLTSLGNRREKPETLSSAQTEAVASITSALSAEEYRTFLLFGVTGSGKTEVYLRAIEAALEKGRSAIVLVPEIALTAQTVGWFRSRFGDVCVLHSGMTGAQRLASWRRLRRGEVSVVVGARSAIFAPLENLGVIVVDEEHEPSFKQETVPRYHARDVAMERARRAGAVCILGSATPALETWTRCNGGNTGNGGTMSMLRLPERVGGGTPPAIHVVDMRNEKGRGRKQSAFSHLLTEMLRETVKAGQQVILFLNRRGFIPVLYCPGCAKSLCCTQCDMSLTYHRQIKRLVCHSCCVEIPLPTACPTCTRPGLRFLGMGSERVEAELRELLPDARVRRMDSDTMRKRQDYEEVLSAFERHEVDVLVGTQMIAKGLDFPRVTLVGIISADPALHLTDFRGAERTFQLIAQVAGRAGRGSLRGRVVVQTRAANNIAIRYGSKVDYLGFAREESALRAQLRFPPHGRLIRVVFEDHEEKRVIECSEELADAFDEQPFGSDFTPLGPAPAPFSLLRGRHRRNIIFKGKLEGASFVQAVDWLAERAAKTSRPNIKVDVDPVSMS